MVAAFIPYQYIHAHLPTSPSPPSSIPELRVPSSRSFPPTTELYTQPLHPEHAISAQHHVETGILARSIYNGHVLELSNFLLGRNSRPRSSETLGSETIRIFFPDRLRTLAEGCIVPYAEDGRVYIILLTENEDLYRLKLSLESYQGHGDRVLFSTRLNEEWCEQWTVPEETVQACGGVGAWTVLDEDTVVLGGGDGGIVRLTRSGRWGHHADWSAHHHRAASKFRLPSLFSRASSDEQIVSIATFPQQDDATLLYTLSRDMKLRTWNTGNGNLLRTIDMRAATFSSSSQELIVHGQQSSSSHGSSTLLSLETDVPLIQILQHPNRSSRYSHILIVFLASSTSSTSGGTFLIYRAQGTQELSYAGARACSTHTAGNVMRSFQILSPGELDNPSSGWRLIVSWGRKGSIYGEAVCLDDILQFTSTYSDQGLGADVLYNWQPITNSHDLNHMDPAYFDKTVSLDPPNPAEPNDNMDITRIFLNHLFYPGRFSHLSLATGLEEYSSRIPKRHTVPQLSASHSSLFRKYEAVVGCTLKMDVDPQTGAPIVDIYRQNLKLQWLGLWTRVRDLDRHARWPIGATSIDNQIITLTREGLTAVIPESESALVYRLGQADDNEAIIEAPNGAFIKSCPTLNQIPFRRAVATISTAGSALVKALQIQDANVDGAVGHSALNDLTENLNANLALPTTQPADAMALSLWDDFVSPYLSDEDQTSLRRVLSATPSTRRAISDTLDVLCKLPLAEPSSTSLPASSLLMSLTTAAISNDISDRYALVRGTLLTTLFHLAESSDDAVDDDEEGAEELLHLVARALHLYHRYRILKWVCEQDGTEVVERRKSASSSNKHKQFAGDDKLALGHMRESGDDPDHGGIDPSYSLLYNLITLADTAYPSSILESANTFMGSSLRILDAPAGGDDEEHDLSPLAFDVQLAHNIYLAGFPDRARELTELYPLSAGMAYVRGLALVQQHLIGEAVRCFEQAAAGCKDGALDPVLPPNTGKSGLSEYYAHVSDTFRQSGYDAPAIYFGQLAIREYKQQAVPRELWTRVFLSNIALGQYEDAYSILTTTPSQDLKKEFLGQLISIMCENNEVGRLNALGFVGFQNEVEKLLRFKARNSDPLRYPNYYKVLYSWHISRGDYRSAGEIMYQQARRFADGSNSKIPAFELTAMQARSYLAAVNALSLVAKRNAWIPFPAPTIRKNLGSKRRRVSSYIPESEFADDRRAIDIITLADIQKEYALVLSKLRLSGHIEELQDQGVSVSPGEVVGLLCQRGLYDLALSTAASLEVDMTDILQSLARKCVELSRMSEINGDTSTASFLRASPLTSRLQGSSAAVALRYLQIALTRYDSVKTHGRYTQAVADTLFELNGDKNNGWEMPSWLVSSEMERDSEAWINRALSWGWIKEALGWAREMLRNATPPELLPPGKTHSTIMPYNLFDRLLAAAAEGDERDDKEVAAAARALKEDITRRIAGLKRVQGGT